METLKSQTAPGVPNEVNKGNFSADHTDEGALGTVVCFAYSIPYTYSDLLWDLEQSKEFLLAHESDILNSKKKASSPLKNNLQQKS